MAEQWDSSLYDDRHSFVWKNSVDLVGMLDPKPGERVLDLGCGTGHLTAQIAERGAEAIGMDSSHSMVAQARQNFPKLKFEVRDARDFQFDQPFDAVFSNAALHWIRDAEPVVRSIAAALKPGGRLVLEMGVRGNVAAIRGGIEAVLTKHGYTADHTWFFPSLGEYATLLEQYGFEVQLGQTFPRWNKLEHPERGLREWVEMFGGAYFKDVPAPAREGLVREMEDRLRPVLFCDGFWFADYRRLRIVAAALGNATAGPLARAC